MISLYSLHCFDTEEVVELFSSDLPEFDILERNDLVDWLRQLSTPSEQTESVFNYAQRNLEKLFAEISGDSHILRAENASELLIYCVQFSESPSLVIPDMVNRALLMLHPSCCPVSLMGAGFLKRMFDCCMEIHFEMTALVIAKAMSEDLVEGVVQNISQSTVIGEALIQIFGSGIPVANALQPSFSFTLFTDSWIKFGLCSSLVSSFVDALSSPQKYRIIVFFRHLFSLGYSPTISPLIDVLLQQDVISTLLDATVTHCSKVTSPSTSVADAVSFFTATLLLVRQSLPPCGVAQGCDIQIHLYPAVNCVCQELHAFVRLLKATIASSKLTRVTGCICLMFRELISFGSRYIDERVKEANFFPVFLDLCETFPNNNTLAQVLNDSYVTISSRLTSEGPRNVLFDYFTTGEGSRLILRMCIAVCNSASFCAFRSHCHRALQGFYMASDSPFSAVIQQKLAFLREEGNLNRLDAMTTLLQDKLTGVQYFDIGSACINSPVQEKCTNFTGGSEAEFEVPKALVKQMAKEEDNVAEDGFDFQNSSSSQVQAYPAFRDVHLLFTPSEDM